MQEETEPRRVIAVDNFEFSKSAVVVACRAEEKRIEASDDAMRFSLALFGDVPARFRGSWEACLVKCRRKMRRFGRSSPKSSESESPRVRESESPRVRESESPRVRESES
ncbi:MAG: hypothetical protein LBQ43_04295, partial [Holosporales bacterium]|nr:hypothetical protein [Holosporales bacterium]